MNKNKLIDKINNLTEKLNIYQEQLKALELKNDKKNILKTMLDFKHTKWCLKFVSRHYIGLYTYSNRECLERACLSEEVEIEDRVFFTSNCGAYFYSDDIEKLIKFGKKYKLKIYTCEDTKNIYAEMVKQVQSLKKINELYVE